MQWHVLWNLDQLVSRVKALLAIGAEWGKAGANSFADGEPGDARTQLIDHANSFETDDNRRIADGHRVRDTCSMVRISEIHADGRAAKTYLATLGRPDLDLLPHEVVGCAFLVDYRRHSHDAFLLLLNVVATFHTSRVLPQTSDCHVRVVDINALRALAPLPRAHVPRPSRPQPRTPPPRWSP